MKSPYWLIREDVGMEMAQAMRALAPITPAMRADFETQIEERRAARAAADGPPNLRVAGDTAEIDVVGVLTEQEDFWLWLLGYANTAYADIRDALMRAQQNPAVKRAVLRVNSPGGNVDGLFETVAALQGFTKPMTATAKMACSAAYDIACCASTIEAENAAACFGSIGVAVRYFVSENIVDITSTEAPNKRPDVRTEEGQAVVRKQLDDLHALFVDVIVAGRKTTVERVNADFGRGGVFLAAEAKRVGMIDSIASALRVAGGVTANKTTASPHDVGAKGDPMEPMTYEQGVAAGVALERKRVNAHIKMGKQCGALDVAFAAINSGAAFADEEVQADYMVAAQKRTAQTDRQADAQTVSDVTAHAAAPTEAAKPDLGDQIVALIDKHGI